MRKTLSVTIFAMAVLFTATVAASARDSQSMLLRYDATVAGSPLASGSYHVEWQTYSPQATVSFLPGNKVVATAESKVVDREKAYPANEVVYNQNSDGMRVIRELRFKESSEVIVFNE